MTGTRIGIPVRQEDGQSEPWMQEGTVTYGIRCYGTRPGTPNH